MDSNHEKNTFNKSAITAEPNGVENNMFLRLQSCSRGLSKGFQDGKGNLVFNSPSLELPLHILQNVKPGQKLRILLPTSTPILVREVTGEFKILFGHPNSDPIPLSATSTSNTPILPPSTGIIQPPYPSALKVQNGSLGKTDSSTQTSYDPGCSKAEFREGFVCKENELLKNDLQCLTKSFDDLKNFLMTQEKRLKEQETEKDNSNSHFAFEVEKTSKKIKLEMGENQFEEIRKLKEEVKRQAQIIEDLKEDNLNLYKKVSDLKWS